MVRAAEWRTSAVFESSLDATRALNFAQRSRVVPRTATPDALLSDPNGYAASAVAAEAAEGVLASARIYVACGCPADAVVAAVEGIAACEASLPHGTAQWVRPSSFEADTARVAAQTPLVVAAARLHAVATAAAALTGGTGARKPQQQAGKAAPPPASPTALPPAVGAHAHAGLLLATHASQCASAVARQASDPRNGPLDLRASALSLALQAASVSSRASVQRIAAEKTALDSLTAAEVAAVEAVSSDDVGAIAAAVAAAVAASEAAHQAAIIAGTAVALQAAGDAAHHLQVAREAAAAFATAAAELAARLAAQASPAGNSGASATLAQQAVEAAQAAQIAAVASGAFPVIAQSFFQTD